MVLEVVSTVQVPSLPAQSMALPVPCSSDGTIFVQLATIEGGVQDPVSISSDGKTIVRFGREKIYDVQQPIPLNMSPTDSGLYMLVLGQMPTGHTAGWRTPTGKVERQEIVKRNTFVARFQRDGTYLGAIALEIPFKPLHLGVFANGDFLIAGVDRQTDEPRVALVGSNGQFLRFVDLSGDVHLRTKPESPHGGGDRTALPRFSGGSADFGSSLAGVVYTSQIASDGRNLLLLRPTNGPVFSISPGGEVHAQELRLQGRYTLYTIKATGRYWIAEVTNDLWNGAEREFATYAFDPSTGAALKQYVYPKDLGFGMACADGDEFTFVMTDSENKTLKLLKVAPSAQTSLQER